MAKRKPPHLLIVEARFYDDIADEMLSGAVAAIEAAGATYHRVSVPGALEIPAAIAMAVAGGGFAGYVALGCVIRGETKHFDIVSEESARALMDLSVNHRLALGNGIQTVENGAQAWARARVSEKNKGGGAAAAAFEMAMLAEQLGVAHG
jgi:6,7-dimethyl-8-ribityllumazine synthase